MTPIAGPCLFLFAHDSISSRIAQGQFDNTFSGIYRLCAFDWSLLIPYFTILAILSVYGIHRYETIRRYRKFRKNLVLESPQKYPELPPVTVQLPIYNERYVVERLLEEVVKLD